MTATPPCEFSDPNKGPCGKPSDRKRVPSEASPSSEAPEHVCLGCLDATFATYAKDLYLHYRPITTPARDVSSLDSDARRRASALGRDPLHRCGENGSEAVKYIVIDSCDGGGSTTQRDLLVARLEAHGVCTFTTAQPSDLVAGRLIRDMLKGRCTERMDPEAFQRLFVADRVDHVARIVEPALARGLTVICDRGELSTVVYYVAGETSIQLAEERANEAFAWHDGIAVPDLTIVLSVPAVEASRRRALRKGPVEIFDAEAFQERVANLYENALSLAMTDPWYGTIHRYNGSSLVVIDGTGEPSEVHDRVWAAVQQVIA